MFFYGLFYDAFADHVHYRRLPAKFYGFLKLLISTSLLFGIGRKLNAVAKVVTARIMHSTPKPIATFLLTTFLSLILKSPVVSSGLIAVLNFLIKASMTPTISLDYCLFFLEPMITVRLVCRFCRCSRRCKARFAGLSRKKKC